MIDPLFCCRVLSIHVCGCIVSEVSLLPDSSNRGLFVPGVAGEALLTYRLSSPHVLPRFGDMVYVKVPQGKGCGFVQYVERRSAEQALAAMHGQVKRNSGSTFCIPVVCLHLVDNIFSCCAHLSAPSLRVGRGQHHHPLDVGALHRGQGSSWRALPLPLPQRGGWPLPLGRCFLL